MADNIEKSVIDAINAIRPALQNDGGDIEFINYDAESKNAHVKLVGACAGCPMSQLTLTNGVQRYIRETVDPEITVINDNQI
ncbi:MAG: NifU family protein [Spirochaetes bacterium]|uniref:NifU family protein n=1 Tax=Candidatus Ornithospirochaeta stercoravium TaxID=2840897 RepID=A0A9D9NE97_9SPIO|nr:NifU family protein [Candidatus Ornithospirochaeta stercoravium]